MSKDDDEQPAKPSQIPLLDDVVSEGKPVRRRRRPKQEKNFDLNLDPDPPETLDLFGDLQDFFTDDETPEEDGPSGSADAAPKTPPAGEDIRAQASEVVDRLVREYAEDMVLRLRSELTQLLEELGDDPAPAPTPTSTPAPRTWDGPELSAWAPWFPVEVAQRLGGVTANWAVVGGWAIDLFLGEHSREHEDIEIELPRTELTAVLPCFTDCELFTVGDGEVRRIRRTEQPPTSNHQLWLVERATGKYRLDIMLVPGDEETWIYRRDETLKVPRAEITLRRNNIPFLSPEIVLFFKAKATRDKDSFDFERCLPRLTSDRRAWLRNALERFHPEHPWLRRL